MINILTEIIVPATSSIIVGIFLWNFFNKPKLYYHENYAYAEVPIDEHGKTMPFFAQTIIILNKGRNSLKNVQIFITARLVINRLS